MIEITFRIPSKKVQYGFVEIKHTGDDEMPSPEQLAKDYTEYVQRFVKAEATATPKKPDSQLVGDVFVDNMPKVTLPTVGALSEVMDDIATKHDIDTSGLDRAKELMRIHLGASVVSETPAPWDGQGEVPKSLEPKPWQKGARKAPSANLFD